MGLVHQMIADVMSEESPGTTPGCKFRKNGSG